MNEKWQRNGAGILFELYEACTCNYRGTCKFCVTYFKIDALLEKLDQEKDPKPPPKDRYT